MRRFAIVSILVAVALLATPVPASAQDWRVEVWYDDMPYPHHPHSGYWQGYAPRYDDGYHGHDGITYRYHVPRYRASYYPHHGSTYSYGYWTPSPGTYRYAPYGYHHHPRRPCR